MRILWQSNSGHAPTGYGNQTGLFVPRLKERLGHEMTVSSIYGLQGAPVQMNGIWQLPCGRDAYGNDVLAGDAQFTGADIVITLIDVWVLHPSMTQQFRWCPWLPVDHEPVPPAVLEALMTGYQPIAYSKWGAEQLQRAGYMRTMYVPHGVDTNKFKPMLRKEARALLGGCPSDTFLVGIVAANKGAPSRKAFDQQIRAFEIFNRKHPNSMLYLHTDFAGVNHGEDIAAIIEQTDIPPACIGRPDAYKYDRGMLGDEYMVAVYNACDVVMNATRGEGFGVPILEAQACGTPVIVTDFSSMSELCFGGWKVPYSDKTFTYQRSYQVIPSVPDLADALEEAYSLNKKQRNAKSDQARAGALQYDADLVTDRYWKPTLDALEASIKSEREPEGSPTGKPIRSLEVG